jgi:GAF domain-containing protein
MVFRFDGSMMHLSAHHNVTPEGLEVLRQQWPMQLDPRSVPARAVLERRVIHVHDVLTEAGSPYLVTSKSLGIRTMLIVPMMRDGHPLGAVAVYRHEVEPFSEQQIALVEIFASQAVIAVENVRLFSELDERNRDLTALGEVGRAVSSTLDLKAVLKTIVDRAVALSDTDGGSIFYYRAELGRFELGETTGLDDEVVAREPLNSTPSF